jgi:hypothetical protein
MALENVIDGDAWKLTDSVYSIDDSQGMPYLRMAFRDLYIECRANRS